MRGGASGVTSKMVAKAATSLESKIYCKILSYVLATSGCYNVFFVPKNDDSHDDVLSIDFNVFAPPGVGRQVTILDISRSRRAGIWDPLVSMKTPRMSEGRGRGLVGCGGGSMS